MSSIVKDLTARKLSHPPVWLPDNTVYEVMMGSIAYGVSNDTSDVDVYGFCIPPKYFLFPHLAGHIEGFGKQKEAFDQYQEHHIKVSEKKMYDVTIYNIAKFFQLAMANNPNMVDALFVPRRCVLSSSHIGELVRENRHIFLHKGCWHKFKGYAYSQLKKMDRIPIGKRKTTYDTHGYDVKFAYHVVRLILEVEQILTEHDLDLERNREQLKAIRNGDWTREQVIEFFELKEHGLEEVYNTSTLRYSPDEAQIKDLLLECLEYHYGNLSSMIVTDSLKSTLANDLKEVLKKHDLLQLDSETRGC